MLKRFFFGLVIGIVFAFVHKIVFGRKFSLDTLIQVSLVTKHDELLGMGAVAGAMLFDICIQ